MVKDREKGPWILGKRLLIETELHLVLGIGRERLMIELVLGRN
jgi:hypothetical protein